MHLTHTRHRIAFTLVEVLVVIAILGVLLGIVIIALSSLQDSAMSAKDLSNQHQIIKVNTNYSVDNKGRLLHPRTIAEEPTGMNHVDDEAISRMWVRDDWQNPYIIPTTPTDQTALEQGQAWEYIGHIEAYRSPVDPTQRMRSYSLNSFVGVNHGADDYIAYGTNPLYNLSTNYMPCPTLSRIPQPSRTLGCIIEEDVDYENNWNGFLVNPSLPNMNVPQWIDVPAWDWTPGIVTIAYMDGSTEKHRLERYRELTETLDSHDMSFDIIDYHFFKNIMLPGRVQN